MPKSKERTPAQQAYGARRRGDIARRDERVSLSAQWLGYSEKEYRRILWAEERCAAYAAKRR